MSARGSSSRLFPVRDQNEAFEKGWQGGPAISTSASRGSSPVVFCISADDTVWMSRSITGHSGRLARMAVHALGLTSIAMAVLNPAASNP